MLYYGIDYYYFILIIPAIILAVYAQTQVSTTFNKYSKISNKRGITGEQACRQVLEQNGVYDVNVERISGKLTDHYDPRGNVIRLSDDVYGSTSVAALGVAAHEAGHAVQYAKGYNMMKVRTAIIPLTKFGSSLSVPLILIGFLFNSPNLAVAGIIFFSFSALFQLVTLPVEFNASSRAMLALESGHILEDDELKGAKKTLSAAALTYVAALIVSVAHILRLLLILGGRRRND